MLIIVIIVYLLKIDVFCLRGNKFFLIIVHPVDESSETKEDNCVIANNLFHHLGRVNLLR